jgi:sirohydrochlorin cobaltochelatase
MTIACLTVRCLYNVDMEKKILIITSRRSTQRILREHLDHYEVELSERFPDYTIDYAHISGQGSGNIEEKKISEDTIVHPLLLIPGKEFHDVTTAFPRQKRSLPLLHSFSSLLPFISTVLSHTNQPKAYTLGVGHGSNHPGGTIFSAMELLAEAENLPFMAGAFEGFPRIEIIIKKLKELDSPAVHIVPFLMAQGKHLKEDVTEGSGSWASSLRREGFTVTCDHRGLFENRWIQELFIERLKNIIV